MKSVSEAEGAGRLDGEGAVLEGVAGAGLVLGVDALDRETAVLVVAGDDEQRVGMLGDVLVACCSCWASPA